MNWEAKSQMQKDVLESEAMIVCAGGSAGTYKSETLLVDAAQEHWKPFFSPPARATSKSGAPTPTEPTWRS
jgi:hypothetical protein